MKHKKKWIIALVTANIIALTYLLFLGYYNNFLIDDYGYLYNVRERGIYWITDLYFNWQGRFGLLAVSFSLLHLYMWLDSLFLLTIVQLAIGYTCFYLLFRYAFNQLNKGLTFLLSVTICNLCILGILEFSTFYWFCASTYITIVHLTILLVYAIFNERLNKNISIPLIVILSFLVGGGVESYTPFVILYLGIALLYRLKKNGLKITLKQRIDRQLIASLFLLSIFLILQLIAPGNKVRMSVDAPVQTTGIMLFLKTGGILLKFMFAVFSKIYYYIMAFPFFYAAGYILREKKVVLSCKYVNKKYFLIFCLLFFVFWYIILTPTVYGLSRLSNSLRSFSYVSFVMITFVGYWGTMLGYKHQNKKLLITTFVIACTCLSGISFYRLCRDYDRAIVYHEEINKRHEYILKLKNEGFEGTAYIDPIYIKNDRLSFYCRSWNFVKKKMNYQAEKELDRTDFPYEKFSLSPDDPKDFRNEAMKKYFDVKFDILLKE